MEGDIRAIDTEMLKLMRKLCPDGKGLTSVSFSLNGEDPVVLTAESRKRVDAELKRRKLGEK